MSHSNYLLQVRPRRVCFKCRPSNGAPVSTRREQREPQTSIDLSSTQLTVATASRNAMQNGMAVKKCRAARPADEDIWPYCNFVFSDR